ncbi:MAG: hypothetical protein U5K84_07340 [Alkalibacterium sp.]|nr:hypothetical protein [Alkalibacterium sp.]
MLNAHIKIKVSDGGVRARVEETIKRKMNKKEKPMDKEKTFDEAMEEIWKQSS